MNNKWEKRFGNLRLFGWLVLIGLPLIVAACLTSDVVQIICGVTGILLFLPGFIYFYVLVILHWKDRYRGRHSDLWGVLILIETSGWMKLVYLFRHMIPDIRHTGRYRPESSQPV
jgi:ABC-type dipeptide/oligopeptide/nickel transport system permease subunit